jgi:hypothetical protein
VSDVVVRGEDVPEPVRRNMALWVALKLSDQLPIFLVMQVSSAHETSTTSADAFHRDAFADEKC